jgi:hypothetical protein
MSSTSYCRDVESYLCRKNDGHLVRIVGPAFDLVCTWADRNVPLSIIKRAIDRAFERYHSKGQKRRPFRIEFCEEDVLEMFDAWCRAVGVSDTSLIELGNCSTRERRAPSLVRHLDRIISDLISGRNGSIYPQKLTVLTDQIIETLDSFRSNAKTVRGEARQRIFEQLALFDQELTSAVRTYSDSSLRKNLYIDAENDLSAFRDRMPKEEFQRAVEAGTDRLLRDHFKLPRISLE